MAVYLVKDQLFEADFAHPSLMQYVSVIPANVNLRPMPDCKKSANFLTDIKASLDSSKDKSTDLSDFSTNGISVKLTVNCLNENINGTERVAPYFDMTFSRNPFAMMVQIGGKFFEQGLKKYTHPVKIQISIGFPTYDENSMLVSRELRLPLDVTESGYTFEQQLRLLGPKYYRGPGKFASGALTIQLLECKRTSFVDVIETTKKILEDKIQCDFALIAKNEKHFACHTNFLAGYSEFFKRLFETNCKEKTERACKIDMTEEAVQALLKFLYCSYLDDAICSSSISFELLEAAHKYDIPSLEKAMKSILMEKPNMWYDLEVAMALFQYALKVNWYQDLVEKAVTVIKSKSDELRACTAYEDLYLADPAAAKELFLLCLDK